MPKIWLAEPATLVTGQPPSKSPAVLVAGAGKAARKCLNIFKKYNLPAEPARSWLQVLDLLERSPFGVLLVESDLKGLNLLEGVRLLHKIKPHLLILVLGPLSSELTAQVLSAGGEGVMPSDLPPEILVDWVQSYGYRQHLRQENDRLRSRILETETYLAQILDQLEEAIVTTDLDGRVMAANHSAGRLFQVAAGEWRQLSLQNLAMVGHGLNYLSEAVKRVLQDGLCEGRFLVAPVGRSPLPVYFRGTVYRQEFQPVGTILVFRDLTAQEELELRAEESERLAALAQIAAGMAHEIRNPLTVVGGLLKRCQRHLPPDSPAQVYLPAIQENIRRLEAMVKEIDAYLRYVRTSGEKWQEVDLRIITHKAVARLKELRDLHNVRLEMALPPDLKIYGDEASLVEMLLQLLLNSVEAMPQGGELRLQIDQEEDQVVLRLADTGHGIAPENLPHISLPFFTTKMTGAGMGLTKVYMIVSRHRGKIEVESRPQQGTTVTLRLPLRK